MTPEQRAEMEIASQGGLDASACASLGEALPKYIASRRWYRAKTRTIAEIEVEDALPLNDGQAQILVLAITYANEETDRYILPVSAVANATRGHQEIITRLVSKSGHE